MSLATAYTSPFEDTATAFASKSNEELRRIYFIFRSFNQPLLLHTGTALANAALWLRLPVNALIKKTVYRQFCGGETLAECEAVITTLARSGIKTVLQYCVETQSSEKDFDRITAELVHAAEFAASHKAVQAISCKFTGIASFRLLEKIQSGGVLSESEKTALQRVRHRMHQMCHAAEQAGIQIFFDAEESWIQQPMDELVSEMMALYNTGRAVVFNTFQLYRTDRLNYLMVSHQKAIKGKYILGAKLVRGAYLEKERIRAKRMGYPSPLHPTKQETDKAYNAALHYCLSHIHEISFYAATHNEQSCLLVMNYLTENGLPPAHPHIYFSQLYGMGEHITYNLARLGFHATKLVPYGPVREAIPYLIRRAYENSSVKGQVSRELQQIEREMKRRKMKLVL
ncbi:MAG: proline dehydrogenase [Chitinophagales bacterium]|nr:MAG: proline dehydrogenase [Chitinophagales bacterium]